jgi:hypothetical protein
MIVIVDGAGRQAGFHDVSEEEVVAAEEEQNCLYHFSQKEQGEQVVSAHYEEEVLGLEIHLLSERMGACQVCQVYLDPQVSV